MPASIISEIIQTKEENLTQIDTINQKGNIHQLPLKQQIKNNQTESINGGNGGGSGFHFCIMGDRINALEHTTGKILGEVGKLYSEVNSIKLTIGDIPDPINGTSGTGMAGLISRMANKVLREHQFNSSPDISRHPSLNSEYFEEGEITKIQDRAELLIRAKVAESEAKAAKDALIEHKNQIDKLDKNTLETSKLKIEKWKIIAGIIGVLIGPGLVTAAFNAIANLLK